MPTAPAGGHIDLFTRRLERVSHQFPDVMELLEAGLASAQPPPRPG
jgi:ATP-dependent DNA ligase